MINYSRLWRYVILSGLILVATFGLAVMFLPAVWYHDLWPEITSRRRTAVPLPFNHLYPGRRTNYLPRCGQVWKSSDPRRLSAFRIMGLTASYHPSWYFETTKYLNPTVTHVEIEMITNPGIAGKTARTIPVERFSITGAKGYTRVS